VADVPRVTDRWLKAFGMKLQARQGDIQILTVGSGPGFVAVAPVVTGEKPGINHFCLGVERFEAKRIMKALEDNGVNARLVKRDGTPEVFVRDPDNITIQLQDIRYCGGSGELGNVCNARG
jgi:catechol 2,3-dioxygenase-like lactoylglutathione lyase family enzyme